MSVPDRVLVDCLSEAVRTSHIDEVPGYLVRVVDDGIWREFDSKMGVKRNETFEEFVTSEPLKGIGTSVATLRRLCSGDTVALDALDRALQRPHGVNAKRTDVNNGDVRERPRGNGSDAALRRLRKDRPDLHERVLLDKTDAAYLSPHAAMVIAGFRHKSVSVRLDDAERAAASIHRQASPEFISHLKELL